MVLWVISLQADDDGVKKMKGDGGLSTLNALDMPLSGSRTNTTKPAVMAGLGGLGGGGVNNMKKNKKKYQNKQNVDDGPAFQVIQPVKGYCQKLEKDYFRLTSAPDPANVRPEPILRKQLAEVKKKWLLTAEYEYTCSQLKSIRQDITVQALKNDFVVEVYETHGRIALEEVSSLVVVVVCFSLFCLLSNVFPPLHGCAHLSVVFSAVCYTFSSWIDQG